MGERSGSKGMPPPEGTRNYGTEALPGFTWGPEPWECLTEDLPSVLPTARSLQVSGRSLSCTASQESCIFPFPDTYKIAT